MAHKKITDSVTSVGTLNPLMRVFDVVMQTEYGTSYNAYLVRGADKTALIDTSHHSFETNFFANIEEVCPLTEIDYIILNHNEPDHSGALGDLYEKTPNATILCTQAGSIYIDAITNRDDLRKRVVKDGERIDLGGLTLEFIIAPFLHWPDSMFTFLKEENILFSCDFLGAHFCAPSLRDTDLVYPRRYKAAFQYYYDCIMSPFAPYVQKALAKIKDLDFQFICPSHGPILTPEGMLTYCLQKYEEWSKPPEKDRDTKNIPIFYTSAYGNTLKAAVQIGNGIRDAFALRGQTANVTLHPLMSDEVDNERVAAAFAGADGFLLGSPTINKAATPPIWVLLSHADCINNKNKPVGVFGSYGWSGEAIPQMNSFVASLGYAPIGAGFKFRFVPSEQDLKDAYQFGVQYAEAGFFPEKAD